MKPAMSILFWLMNFWEFDPIVEHKKGDAWRGKRQMLKWGYELWSRHEYYVFPFFVAVFEHEVVKLTKQQVHSYFFSMIIRGHNHFICYFFDHVCFHFPFIMVLSKCKGSRQKQITTKSSLHFEEISILLSCPSTDSKIVCPAPNLLCHTKLYLDIVHI